MNEIIVLGNPIGYGDKIDQIWDDCFRNRNVYAQLFLNGNGLEIGALHKPTKVPDEVDCKYMDSMTTSELHQRYPSLLSEDIVEIDIIDRVDTFECTPINSLGFIIANHVLEHCEDFIKVVGNCADKLIDCGKLFFSVPDKRYTFGAFRENTSFEHHVRDYHRGPEISRRHHYLDYSVHTEHIDQEKPEIKYSRLINCNEDIHFHVFDYLSFHRNITEALAYLEIEHEVLLYARNGFENLIVIQVFK